MIKRLKAFFIGIKEFRSGITTNPGADLIEDYDKGRDLAHRMTFRRWDQCHK